MGRTEPSDRQDHQIIEQAIRLALRGIRFGSIEIIVHDSKVVQIERKERYVLPAKVQRPRAEVTMIRHDCRHC
ncbi:MAG: DUF2292 domain-containing protein [Nitrospirae bacterium]|nr:MAG: DUF2292 domain-containing protein [Nitrospirota bacterium]